MHCPDERTLTAFTDGELAPSQAGDVEQHLAGCRACAEAVQDLRQLNALGRSALALIPVTPTAVRPARRPAARIQSGRLRFSWGLAGVAAAAAAVFAVVAARWLVTGPPAGGRDRVGVVGTTTPIAVRHGEEATPSPPLLDDDFARWSAEHQHARIPRIPLEQLADYHPAPMLPMLGPDAKPRS
jgi:hypothetical protein